MKIAIDSNDIPAAKRLDTWSGLLCDTYVGMDCHFPGDEFRSVMEGYAVGDHTITRLTSSQHYVDRSPTLIKRDGLEIVYFGVVLAGRLGVMQGGRESVAERGAVVVSDSTRPFRTYIDEAADVVWLGVPKQPILDRVRGLEDLTAMSLVPAQPITDIALGFLAGFEEALNPAVPPHDAEQLTTLLLDTLALTIISGDGLQAARSAKRPPLSPMQ